MLADHIFRLETFKPNPQNEKERKSQNSKTVPKTKTPNFEANLEKKEKRKKALVWTEEPNENKKRLDFEPEFRKLTTNRNKYSLQTNEIAKLHESEQEKVGKKDIFMSNLCSQSTVLTSNSWNIALKPNWERARARAREKEGILGREREGEVERLNRIKDERNRGFFRKL